MKTLPRISGTLAAATLVLSLGACSKEAEQVAPETGTEATQSEEVTDEVTEEEASEKEASEDAEEPIEREGVGPARVDAGFVAFDVGEGMGWEILKTPADNNFSSVSFWPEDGQAQETIVSVTPGAVYSFDEATESCREILELVDLPLQDLGNVDFGGTVYHKFALISEDLSSVMTLCTNDEPTEALVQIQTPAAEGSWDFAVPEAMDLLFETIEYSN